MITAAAQRNKEEDTVPQTPMKTGKAITRTDMVTLKGLSKAKDRTLIVGEVVGFEEGGLDVGTEVG